MLLAHPGDLRYQGPGAKQTSHVPPVKILSQKFQRKVATNITAPGSIYFSLDKQGTQLRPMSPSLHIQQSQGPGTAQRHHTELQQRHKRTIKALNTKPERTPKITSYNLVSQRTEVRSRMVSGLAPISAASLQGQGAYGSSSGLFPE